MSKLKNLAHRRVMAAMLFALVLPPGFVDTRNLKEPDHLVWARRLVAEVTPATNTYASKPTVVTWKGVSGATETRNRSVCSALVAHLMMQAYGYRAVDFAPWLGGQFPRAAGFHDAIAAGQGFDRVLHIPDIRPGDVLAIKYPTVGPPTGHVMLAAGFPVKRVASERVIPGTTQYEIWVIDSSNRGHGPTDTRHHADGTFQDGVGRGRFRLYGGVDGRIVGYSWSLLKSSTFYQGSQRNLVVGRLNWKVKPTGRPGKIDAGAAQDSGDDDGGGMTSDP